MPFVRPQPIIDIEDIIIILVVIPIIVRGLAWLGKHSSGVMRRLVSERGVTDMVRLDNIGRQLPYRL